MNLNRTTIVATLIGAVALVVSVALFSAGLKHFRSKTVKTVSVTGKSEHNFEADLIVWKMNIKAEAPTLSASYAELKKGQEAVRKFFADSKIPQDEISYDVVDIARVSDDYYDNNTSSMKRNFKGYSLTQTVKITSKNLSAVETVAQKISDLISQGVEVDAHKPSYYYTKLDELKVKMLQEAAEDARERAKVIADGADASLGSLQKASMGTFQIIGLYSNEDYSWGGSFNTESKMKTASVTVSSVYSVK